MRRCDLIPQLHELFELCVRDVDAAESHRFDPSPARARTFMEFSSTARVNASNASAGCSARRYTTPSV